MASKEKSFEELLKEAPAAPATGSVSLVGALAQSSEPGKFALTLQDGSIVTLETASVKDHTVLGTSVGQPIVRVEVDAARLLASAPGGAAWNWLARGTLPQFDRSEPGAEGSTLAHTWE